MLDKYRTESNQFLAKYADPFLKYNPNTLTLISFVFSLLAALTFLFSTHRFPYPLLLVPIFIFLNAAFDVMDGYVAKTTGRASARGDFLDHTVDRYSDIILLLGITFSPFCNNIVGLAAIISILLVSYMGTQAQAVGVKRIYAGVMGRADRLAVLILLPWIQFFLVFFGFTLPTFTGLSFNITDYVMIWFIVAGNITALYRAGKAWSMLGDNKNG